MQCWAREAEPGPEQRRRGGLQAGPLWVESEARPRALAEAAIQAGCNERRFSPATAEAGGDGGLKGGRRRPARPAGGSTQQRGDSDAAMANDGLGQWIGRL